jgi:hypothetical protein
MQMLVARGRIGRETIVRGPSTRQFWMFARNTPGIAHLLGECHACHRPASPSAASCTHCQAAFGVEEDRQYLGLAEVRLIPGQATAETIARSASGRPRPEPEQGSGTLPLAFDTPGSDSMSELRDGAATVYEPTRHPARVPRSESDLSEAQIDALLRRSGASERAKRGTGIVIAVIAAALLGIGLVVMAAVAIVGQAAANRATNAGAAPAKSGGPATPGTPAPTPAGASPGSPSP